MPICTRHAMQEESWTAAQRHSKPDTPFYALLNGIAPDQLPPLPDGMQVIYEPSRYEDECDLWNDCLALAVKSGWDWCMVIHDDFRMMESGWEDDLALSEGWRVCLASWLGYGIWTAEANSGYPTSGHLAVALDSFSFGFKVDVFKQRGYVAGSRYGFGYGAWESNAWALQNDYAVWRILLDSWHQWLPNENARSKLGVGAPGHPDIRQRFAGVVLPSEVVDTEHIKILDRIVRIAPEGVTDAGRKADCLNAGQVNG